MRPKSNILQRLAFAYGGYALLVVILTETALARVILLGVGLLPLALSAWVYRQIARQIPYRFARTWPHVMPPGVKPGVAANDNRRWRPMQFGKN